MSGAKRDWRPLPAPHSRVRVVVEVYRVGQEPTVFLEARGTPDALVACGLALPEWVPAGNRGKRKSTTAPDGSAWYWADRSPKKAEWRVRRSTESLEVAKRWPGVPADIAFAEPAPELEVPASQQWRTSAEWKADMVSRMHDNPLIIEALADRIASASGRFIVELGAAAEILALHARFHREFIERFAAARIIDRQAVAPGLRLVVDNTRPGEDCTAR